MFSLEKCTAILNKDSKKYTREEIILIRDYLVVLASIEYEISKLL